MNDVSMRAIILSLQVKVVLKRHDRVRAHCDVLELPLNVELYPMRVGIGDIVAEVPGELSDDRRIRAAAILVKSAELCRDTPAP